MINSKMRELGACRSVIRELFEYGKKRKLEVGDENVFDFSLGNPSIEPPEILSESILKLVSEKDPIALHGYTSAQGDLSARCAIADHLKKSAGARVSPDGIYITVGAAAALTSTLTALVTPSEEVILLAPYFPEYKVFTERCGGIIRPVKCDEETFMPNISRIEEAITEKTAAIIINSPNNPSGAVYSEACIKDISELLRRKSKELGKTIYIISDEPYRELAYDGTDVPYIPNYYENTVVCYSFSKSLSIPGERIGYAAVSDSVTEKRAVYEAIAGAARALGFVCAPSLLQHLIPYCIGNLSDISVYDRNRRLLYESLSEYGYTVAKPQGAFYIYLKSPTEDSSEFSEEAKKHELLLVPGEDFGFGGYVRIAYCVRTEVVLKSLPAFKRLAEHYKL